MAKKKHAEEHENLERWLVSYADFITLLFATFVVLYALSQVDISSFKALEESIKNAFSAPNLIQGSAGIMDSSGESILASGVDTKDMAFIPPILEQSSPKYEESSFNKIKESLDELEKTGELDGINTTIVDRGLVISIMDSVLFNSGNAAIRQEGIPKLQKIGEVLKSKFNDHLIRVEGHTDSIAIKTQIYPSNWELSSARASSIVRFFINNFHFKQSRFAAVGYADTRPITSNNTEAGRIKNRRVEIVVLRNRLTGAELKATFTEKSDTADAARKSLEKQQQEELKKYTSVSGAAKKLAKDVGQPINNVVLFEDPYKQESDEIAKKIKEQEAKKRKELKLPDISLQKPVNVSESEKKIIDQAERSGQINSAVAGIMKERGLDPNNSRSDTHSTIINKYSDTDIIKKIYEDSNLPGLFLNKTNARSRTKKENGQSPRL